jgi:release factor glutamine methyltransferase
MDEAELLFTHLLNCDRMSLYLNKDLPLEKNKSVLISSVLKCRMRGEPLQYILGKTEFMGLEFKVSPDVLIPRPETELLVEVALAAARLLNVSGPLEILEIGTGSGCIAVSLAKFIPRAKISATDVSPEALEIARENAAAFGVQDRVKFIHSDLFAALPRSNKGYALCISNPPYVVSSQIQRLQPELSFEPRIALDGGSDGLEFYRKLINPIYSYLDDHGLLIIEIGLGQKDAVLDMLRDSGKFQVRDVIKDYNRIDRVVVERRRS